MKGLGEDIDLRPNERSWTIYVSVRGPLFSK